MNALPPLNQAVEDSLAHGARPVVPMNAGDTFYDEQSRSIWMRLPYNADDKVIRLAEALLKELGHIKTDPSYLSSLWTKLEDVQAQAEDVGSEVYQAMCALARWAELQLDECEYRKQNGIEA